MRLHLSLALFVIVASAQAQTVRRDIAYTTDDAGAQKGDLYQPSGVGPFAAVVYLHGGSWRSGDKKEFAHLGSDLAAKGYAVFSIDYDLKPHSYPTSIEEAEAAIHFLRDHAAEYHLNPARIAVAGASAGGEIAALVALNPKNHAAAGIMLNSVYDLTGKYHVIERYLGGPCESIGNTCSEASPMSHIHADAPPFFVGHGTGDRVVPFASAQLFASQMKAAGNSVTVYAADGGPHMYFEKKDLYAANLAALSDFLAKTFAASHP